MTRLPQKGRIARRLAESNPLHCRRLSTRWKGPCFQHLKKPVPAEWKVYSQPRMHQVTARWRKARCQLATNSLPACSTEQCLEKRRLCFRLGLWQRRQAQSREVASSLPRVRKWRHVARLLPYRRSPPGNAHIAFLVSCWPFLVSAATASARIRNASACRAVNSDKFIRPKRRRTRKSSTSVVLSAVT